MMDNEKILQHTPVPRYTHTLHTHYLQTSVRVDLSYVSCTEPPLTLLVHKVVLAVTLVPIVTHSDVRPSNQNLPSGVRFVPIGVASLQPVPESDLTADDRSSNSTRAVVCH